jgi:hypothetical protein
MSALVEVTTHTGRLRHLAREEDLSARFGPGRDGRSLCQNSIQTTVYDQEAFDAERQKWSSTYTSKSISVLPPCKKCAKSGGAA